ncbi:hypothetical protein ACQP2T_45055 [Nonomuraea sp. CA-143628]|uniref:hypothetical protein n=1 Tax=Nonomuraea sp. CA-143628 TaxID=3239997 RepID=UPI003D91B27D
MATPPFHLNDGYGDRLIHDVYNVVPADNLLRSPWREVFVGYQSLICKNMAVIQSYGFGSPKSPCGAGDRPLDTSLAQTAEQKSAVQTLKTAQAAKTAAASGWVSAKFPTRQVVVTHGRCKFVGYWWMGSLVVPSGYWPSGSTMDVTGYVEGPKCAVSINLQVVHYQQRTLTTYTMDHYRDDSKPSGNGNGERWMKLGWLPGGSYSGKVGNVIHLVNFQVNDLTMGSSLGSVGQIWGPPANWCDNWKKGLPPGCTA